MSPSRRRKPATKEVPGQTTLQTAVPETSLPEGVRLVTLNCGEVRYQATAKIKGTLVLLGWYSTPQKAAKARNNALNR